VVPLGKVPIPGSPTEFLSADVVCPLPRSRNGNLVILTVCCHFTNFLFGVALPGQKAKTVARALVEKVFLVHGVPISLLTNKGTNFTSKLVKEVSKYWVSPVSQQPLTTPSVMEK
jgi:hypothetical protein